jgi:hypothetical protein
MIVAKRDEVTDKNGDTQSQWISAVGIDQKSPTLRSETGAILRFEWCRKPANVFKESFLADADRMDLGNIMG